ncbi:putative Se/S carrier-like protein [Tissierella praeacuta]|uniref:putative Se/S carrier-like protein n=1 Tax=Tissierella praeacuta TaxID=43131 RepID=UPI002898134D|nr:putative Se/S carrier-like protein [Tissierella praeacuta]
MNRNYYMAVFQTKNKAVFLYSVLESIGYTNFQLISTPCTIKAGCNYAIKFINIKYADILIKEAKELDIGTPDIYIAENKDGRYKYKKIYI